jgi:O-antigen/teichoic acid export membrane protein
LKRKFVTNLALLLFLNILIKPLYAFGIDVGVQNAVGVSQYGNYFVLLNFTLIFQILLDLGIENFSRREIARHSHMLNRYFSNILPLKIILGLLYLFICTGVGYFMEWHAYEWKLLLIMLLNQFLASFILYFRANLGGLHMFKADSIVSVIDRFVVIVICGFLLLDPVTKQSFRIEWLILSQTAAYLIGASIAFSLVFAKTANFRLKIDLRHYILLFRQSLPFALLILLMTAYFRLDPIFLDRLLENGQEQAGVYAQSFRIIEILSNYGYLFTIILLPLFSRMIRQKESVEHITKYSALLMLVPALILAVGCLAYRREIIELLYHEHVETSARVFGILIFSFLGMCTTYIFGTLLTANGNLLQLNIMAFFALLINITLNFTLISRFGIIGSAIANMITQVFTSLCQVIMVKRIFKFTTNYHLLMRLGFFVLVIIIAGFLCHQIPMPWFYSLIIFGILTLGLSFVFRLLQFRSLASLLAQEQQL